MRLHLYLPDDKKEFVEEVRLLLQLKGLSVSQLFLKCLEKFASEHENELRSIREFKMKSQKELKDEG